jgi:hypothetical protein
MRMAIPSDLATILVAESLLLGGMAAYIEGHAALAGACLGALAAALALHFGMQGRNRRALAAA